LEWLKSIANARIAKVLESAKPVTERAGLPCKKGKCVLPAIPTVVENVRIAGAWEDLMRPAIQRLPLQIDG